MHGRLSLLRLAKATQRPGGKSHLYRVTGRQRRPKYVASALPRHADPGPSKSSGTTNLVFDFPIDLDLEPGLKEKARSNQRAGGQHKGSSKLTEADSVDVRSKVAREAGVSVGNVTKVKQLVKTQSSTLQGALRAGQIRIHKAWKWRQLSPEGQLKELELYLSQKGTNRVIRQLIKRHVAKRPPIPPTQPNLGDLLNCRPLHESGELASISVVVIDAPENIAFLTKGALRILGSLEE